MRTPAFCLVTSSGGGSQPSRGCLCSVDCCAGAEPSAGRNSSDRRRRPSGGDGWRGWRAISRRHEGPSRGPSPDICANLLTWTRTALRKNSVVCAGPATRDSEYRPTVALRGTRSSNAAGDDPRHRAPNVPCEVHVLTSAYDWDLAVWGIKSFYNTSGVDWPLVIHDGGGLTAENMADSAATFRIRGWSPPKRRTVWLERSSRWGDLPPSQTFEPDTV